MEYTNPRIPEHINVTEENPLKTFVVKGGQALLVFMLCLMLISFIASLLAPLVPFSWEQKVGARFFPDMPPSPEEVALRRIANNVAKVMNLPKGMTVSIHYNQGETVNAFATFGGHIVVFRGMLRRLSSEDELVALLAHEIAHIKHRDISRGLLRGLGATLLMAGIDSVGPILNGTQEMSTLSFSRKQESQADQEAVDAVLRLYGHGSGATLLFTVLRQVSKESGGKEDLEIMSSHPDLTHRINRVQERCQKLGWPARGPLTPLPAVLAGGKKQEKIKAVGNGTP